MDSKDRQVQNPLSPHKADIKALYPVKVSTSFIGLTPGRRSVVYQTIVDRVNAATLLLDAGATIMFASVGYENVTGYDATESTGRDLRDTIVAEDRRAFDERWGRVLSRTDSRLDIQFRFHHGGGGEAWMEMDVENRLDDPDVNAMVVVIRNITKRKNAEEAVLRTESRWRFMAESLPVLIFTIDAKGDMEYANPQWREYAGVDLELFVRDRAVQDSILHPEDREGFRKTWLRTFRNASPMFYQCRLRRKDGVYRWHTCRIQPMKQSDGSVSLWIGSCTDTEDLYQAMLGRHELELRTARLDVQRQELLELNRSKDEFISLASHQLRTPATGVKQYLAMMLQGFAGEVSDDQRAFLQTAYDSNERQISIVNDLLKVAQIDAGKVRLTVRRRNLGKIVKKAVNEHAGHASESNKRLQFKTDDAAIQARFDADMFRMALDNVIDNAIKYSPPDSKIVVRVWFDKRSGCATVSVTDQGDGMTAQEVGKIFSKFSRLENPLTKAVDGSGLGLYWAKRVMDLHEGSIKVRSKPGRGTTFSLTLPV